MDHYLDIRVMPDPEFKESVLMNALFAKLHRVLVDVGRGELGVSFPDVGITLGTRLRLHGSADALTRLMAQNWRKGLRDYTECGDITAVPVQCEFRVVQRVQVKSSPERLRRRSVGKGWLTAHQAQAQIPDSKAKTTRLPYLQMSSISTGQEFRLFVAHGPLVTTAVAGVFSDYGLSIQATIPWF